MYVCMYVYVYIHVFVKTYIHIRTISAALRRIGSVSSDLVHPTTHFIITPDCMIPLIV